MNRLTVRVAGNWLYLYDLDIKFPDDIKLGSYSITIPNTPELSKVFLSGSFDAELDCLLNYDENAGSIHGKVVVTSRTPDSITFNFIRVDSGTVHKYVSDGESYALRLPTIDSGLSAFRDTKVSTIGTYKAYDFTSDAQGELTWRNIYGLKTSPRAEPIEKFAADHTSVWGDVDPVTACNPLGDACTENYSFRYDGDASYKFGGQNRLMTTRLVKFTCLETGFYDMNVGNIDFEVDNHMSVYLPDSKVLNISNSMYTSPSIDLAIIEDDKFDELKDDFMLYPKQESYISVKKDQSMDGEVKDFFNKLLKKSPTYPYDPSSTDNPYIGMPTGYTIGVESDLFSLSRITWTDSSIDSTDARTAFDAPSNKDGVVAAHRLAWSGYSAPSELYGILPCDVRGMMCTGAKDNFLKMVPLYDGSLRSTFSSNAPFPEKAAASAPKYRIYFGNRVVRLGFNSNQIHSYPESPNNHYTFSTKNNKLTTKVVPKGKFGTVFLEAGKTYSLVVQVSSCPVMVMLNGRKELRYMFPKELRADYDKILDEVTFNRSVLDEDDFIINPPPHDVGEGKLSELPVIDSLDGSFWNTADAGNVRFNTISLNPNGDYYDFARGVRGSNENKLIDVRAYNKFMFYTILTMDFKVTVSTSLREFSLGIRDVDGVYKDSLIFDFFQGYDGVNPVTLYNGGFIALYSPSVDISTPMLNGITKSKMEFAVRNNTVGEELANNTIVNAFEDTHTLTFNRNATPQYYYDFLSLNHDTAKEINNYIEVENFPCQFRTDAGTWVTVCSSNIVDVLNIDTVKETCTVRLYLPTAGYLL